MHAVKQKRAKNVKPAVEPDTQDVNLPQPAATGNQPINQEASVQNSQNQRLIKTMIRAL